MNLKVLIFPICAILLVVGGLIAWNTFFNDKLNLTQSSINLIVSESMDFDKLPIDVNNISNIKILGNENEVFIDYDNRQITPKKLGKIVVKIKYGSQSKTLTLFSCLNITADDILSFEQTNIKMNLYSNKVYLNNLMLNGDKIKFLPNVLYSNSAIANYDVKTGKILAKDAGSTIVTAKFPTLTGEVEVFFNLIVEDKSLLTSLSWQKDEIILKKGDGLIDYSLLEMVLTVEGEANSPLLKFETDSENVIELTPDGIKMLGEGQTNLTVSHITRSGTMKTTINITVLADINTTINIVDEQGEVINNAKIGAKANGTKNNYFVQINGNLPQKTLKNIDFSYNLSNFSINFENKTFLNEKLCYPIIFKSEGILSLKLTKDNLFYNSNDALETNSITVNVQAYITGLNLEFGDLDVVELYDYEAENEVPVYSIYYAVGDSEILSQAVLDGYHYQIPLQINHECDVNYLANHSININVDNICRAIALGDTLITFTAKDGSGQKLKVIIRVLDIEFKYSVVDVNKTYNLHEINSINISPTILTPYSQHVSAFKESINYIIASDTVNPILTFDEKTGWVRATTTLSIISCQITLKINNTSYIYTFKNCEE